MRERGAMVTARLALLVASMRAGGARVGVGDLIGAHRALGAVDASSRTDGYLALRAALCTRREDLELFDAAFEGVFGMADGGPRTVGVELPEAAGLVLPRMAVPPPPGQGDVDGPPPDETAVPAAW